MEQIAEGKEGLCLSLERARLRGLLVVSWRLGISSTGCQESRMIGIEILEVTRRRIAVDRFLRKWSINMRLVAGRSRKWTSMEQ